MKSMHGSKADYFAFVSMFVGKCAIIHKSRPEVLINVDLMQQPFSTELEDVDQRLTHYSYEETKASTIVFQLNSIQITTLSTGARHTPSLLLYEGTLPDIAEK